MPKFRSLSLAEAMIKTASGKRAQVIKEYLGFIEQLGRDEAGHLQVDEGESIAAVRRRLGDAARQAGLDLRIRRTGEEIYFWVEKVTRRRRSRRSSQ